jgi:hypothetical protein
MHHRISVQSALFFWGDAGVRIPLNILSIDCIYLVIFLSQTKSTPKHFFLEKKHWVQWNQRDALFIQFIKN